MENYKHFHVPSESWNDQVLLVGSRCVGMLVWHRNWNAVPDFLYNEANEEKTLKHCYTEMKVCKTGLLSMYFPKYGLLRWGLAGGGEVLGILSISFLFITITVSFQECTSRLVYKYYSSSVWCELSRGWDSFISRDPVFRSRPRRSITLIDVCSYFPCGSLSPSSKVLGWYLKWGHGSLFQRNCQFTEELCLQGYKAAQTG